MNQTSEKSGALIAVTAFVLWGLFPFYFKAIAAYAPFEIIVHRFVWTGVLACLILVCLKQWDWLSQIKKQPKWLLWLVVTAALMFTNTLTYVWAVNTDRVLEASFGYFICPLVAIVLAMIFLGERLSRWQLIAVVLATMGVLIQLVLLGYFPLIGLVVSTTFALYGLLHKQMPIHAFPALFLETLLISPPALAYLFTQDYASSEPSFWLSRDVGILLLAGPVTLIPLSLYNIAVKRTTLTAVSFLGYITPTIVFSLAVFYYHEQLTSAKLGSFVFIWLGLAVFSVEMIYNSRQSTGK